MIKINKTIISVVISAVVISQPVYAEENVLTGIKLGFGFDRNFGVVGSIGRFNGFIGNKGASVDYVLNKYALQTELQGSTFWYIGAGGYGDWDGDIGVRVPVGARWDFAENLDAFAQIMPQLRVNHDAKFGLGFSIGVRYQF